MEKIIVIPEEVRGLGNIVNPKTGADFTCANSNLGVSTAYNGISVFGVLPDH